MANMIALTAARILVLILEIGLALPFLYLTAVAVSAVVASWRKAHMPIPPAGTPPSCFAILVPAYNEEALIGEVLASLAKLDYPSDLYAVHVIADNCTDNTADIARACGAHVHERADVVNRGKGHALAWAIALLFGGPVQYDAYVVLDADSVVAPTFLAALDRYLARGGKALQSHNAVLNASESPTAALRWLALSLMNYIRPLGRNTFGGSSTLTGNGMCLSRELLMRHPWKAFGLSEDYQYYLALVADGGRVLFVPDADVRSVMPNTTRQLQTQDIRWESPRSRFRQLAASHGPAAAGVRHPPGRLGASRRVLRVDRTSSLGPGWRMRARGSRLTSVWLASGNSAGGAAGGHAHVLRQLSLRTFAPASGCLSRTGARTGLCREKTLGIFRTAATPQAYRQLGSDSSSGHQKPKGDASPGAVVRRSRRYHL